MAIHHNLNPHAPAGVTRGAFRIEKAADRLFISAPGTDSSLNGRRVFVAEVMVANSKQEQAANACMLLAAKDLMECMSRILTNPNKLNPRDRQLAENAMARAQGRIP